MGELSVEAKQIVVPGETLARGLDFLPGDGTYRDGETIRSSVLGLSATAGRLVKVIPLGGRYIPKEGDLVIGVVNEVRFSNWEIDINSPYGATLPISEATDQYIDTRREDLSSFYDVGDTVIAEIIVVDDHMNVNITLRGPGLRKLREGKVIDVAAAKVPRIIGKSGSMVRLIKEATGCQVVVGQNGKAWLKGTTSESEEKAVKAIRMVEAEAHTSGLTDRVKAFLGFTGEISAAPERGSGNGGMGRERMSEGRNNETGGQDHGETRSSNSKW